MANLEKTLEKIDETIINICNWLDDELINHNIYPPETIKALAELLSERANLEKNIKENYFLDLSESSKE